MFAYFTLHVLYTRWQLQAQLLLKLPHI